MALPVAGKDSHTLLFKVADNKPGPQTSYMQYKNNNPFGVQAKMMFHQDRIHEYLTRGDTNPIEMEVNLTNKCNMACKWCISSNFRGKESLDAEIFSDFCHDFKAMGGKALVFSGGGEPTCHPDFITFVEIAKNYKLELGLMTNGFYDDSYNEIIGMTFKWVRFSIDTLDEAEYKKWKGINALPQVLDSVDNLHRFPVKIGINCNIGPEHTIKGVKKFERLLYYADYIQFRPVLPRYYLKEKIQINKPVWDYLAKCESPIISLSNDKREDLTGKSLFPFRKCEGHFFVPILNADGDVCVCMYHPKDDRFVFGNIYKDDFKTIWKSKQRKRVIEFVRGLDYKRFCQQCCKLCEINKFLDFINHPEEGVDINFL